MKRLVLGFTLLAASWATLADDIALYKVELIVFENLDPRAILAEDWPENPGAPPLDNAMELSSLTAAATKQPLTVGALPPSSSHAAAATSPPPPTWRLLNDSELSLDAKVRRLDNSHRYKTIVHVGWIQPVDSSDHGQAVHIYDGMLLKHAGAITPREASVVAVGENDIPKQSPVSAATTQQYADQDAAPSASPISPHILDGTFTLSRGRFLHVAVDLGYTKTVNPGEITPTSNDSTIIPPATASYYVRMTQSRRIRNDELNYLDHPLFGVLFLVSPYEENGTNAATE